MAAATRGIRLPRKHRSGPLDRIVRPFLNQARAAEATNNRRSVTIDKFAIAPAADRIFSAFFCEANASTAPVMRPVHQQRIDGNT